MSPGTHGPEPASTWAGLRRHVEACARRLVGSSPDPRIVVYTAIFGGRDRLYDPTVLTPDSRYVCFTDEPLPSEVWEVVRVPPSDDPRRASRYYKTLPHRVFDTDYSLWVDGSFRINVDVRRLIARHLTRAPIAAFAHWESHCTYDFAQQCIAARRSDPDTILRQMSRYRQAGFPERAGLWNGGVLLRRHNRRIRALNERWWHELEIGSVRDELGFSYCTWQLGVPVATIGGHTLQNSELEMMDHRQERWKSEFEEVEWADLSPPPAISTFPDDLGNTALVYGGIYSDGWVDSSAYIGLGQPTGPSRLVLRGMVPLVDDPELMMDLRVFVDGREVARRKLGLGEFEVSAAVPSGDGRRFVRLDFSGGQVLPEPFPRRVAALLHFIGIEPDSDEAPATDADATGTLSPPLARERGQGDEVRFRPP